VDTVLILRDQYLGLVNTNNELEQENNRLKAELSRLKIQQVNKTANQPTSKQPERELYSERYKLTPHPCPSPKERGRTESISKPIPSPLERVRVR